MDALCVLFEEELVSLLGEPPSVLASVPGRRFGADVSLLVSEAFSLASTDTAALLWAPPFVLELLSLEGLRPLAVASFLGASPVVLETAAGLWDPGDAVFFDPAEVLAAAGLVLASAPL